LTFRDPPPGSTWTQPGWTYAKTAWKGLEGLLRPALGELRWVRAFEIQKWRGVPHIHALVGNLDNLRYAEAGSWWWEHYGLCKIEEYNPLRGAGYYLCKYVSKELVDLTFSDALIPT